MIPKLCEVLWYPLPKTIKPTGPTPLILLKLHLGPIHFSRMLSMFSAAMVVVVYLSAYVKSCGRAGIQPLGCPVGS